MSEEELRPATFQEEEDAFAPRRPWKWIIGVPLALALVIGFYQWRDRSRILELRQGIATEYQREVMPVAARVNPFRDKLEGWITEVGQDSPETWADPRLDLSGLHRASGVYLRIHADSTSEHMAIRDSALTMEPDAITRCLGLAPLSLRGFYERNEFLTNVWLDDALAADTALRLRVFQDEMARRIERDLPLMTDMTQSDYFLLVLQHGENRHDEPVDVYLWDLRSNQLLLKTRARANGTLIPVRNAIGGPPTGTARPLAQRSGVADCSIASQIRAVTGRTAPSVVNDMPEGEFIERAPRSDDEDASPPRGAAEPSEVAEPSEIAEPTEAVDEGASEGGE